MTYEEVKKLDDRAWAQLLKEGSDPAWKRVWFEVLEPETRRQRNSELMRKWSVTEGDIFGILYKEMVGDGKLANWRGDGGSLVGWMRAYVRGYVTRSNPTPHGEFSLEGTAKLNEQGEELPLPVDDHGVAMHDIWMMTYRCFKDLWNDDPRKAYVLYFKTRMHLSSAETADLLDIPTEAATDQIFSRAVKEMRAAWPRHEKGEWKNEISKR